jgi:hypothetical protein
MSRGGVSHLPHFFQEGYVYYVESLENAWVPLLEQT